MFKIHVNGRELQYDAPVKAGDVGRELLGDAFGAVLAAEIDGEPRDLYAEIAGDCALRFLTDKDPAGAETLRHTAAHVLAQAVKRLYPAAKLAVGPATKEGFYYDIDCEETFTPEALQGIEKEMKKIIKEGHRPRRSVLPREEAIALMEEMGESYKVELIRSRVEAPELSFYTQGEFTDFCLGPHLPSVSKIKAFALTGCTGAYWLGDARNKMLQRIYGIAFTSKEELERYLERIAEAERRDHRKLGRELDLFALMEEGPGFPFFLPKGMVIRNALEDYWREMHREAGYVEIKTPIILSEQLWHRSGHWDHYQDNMYFTKIDDGDYAIKPMNCPGGMLAYKRHPVSYRDLPLRVGELGLVHRHELSGALHGLFRVRCFTQDDAHIFMTDDQVMGEIAGVIALIDRFYKLFGFHYHVELSTCPPDFMGTDEQRAVSEGHLREALLQNGLAYVVNEGDGAFYGPKIDFHIEDSLGRSWQCATIQLDYQMPERFELEYTGRDGEKHRPVMIHRVIFGSIERFIGILIEHFAGAFPLWLSPVQVAVLPIGENQLERAREIHGQLEAAGLRSFLDTRNEKIGFKIREAQVQKTPYMLLIGEKEIESGEVSLRSRRGGDRGSFALGEVIAGLRQESAGRSGESAF